MRVFFKLLYILHVSPSSYVSIWSPTPIPFVEAQVYINLSVCNYFHPPNIFSLLCPTVPLSTLLRPNVPLIALFCPNNPLSPLLCSHTPLSTLLVPICPLSPCFFPLLPQPPAMFPYSSQHPFSRNPQSVFLPQEEFDKPRCSSIAWTLSCRQYAVPKLR
jgi:hypothetical protein